MKRTFLLVAKESEILNGNTKGEINYYIQVIVKRNKITDKYDYIGLKENGCKDEEIDVKAPEVYTVDLDLLFSRVNREDGSYDVEMTKGDLVTDYTNYRSQKNKVTVVNFNNVQKYYEQTNEKGITTKNTKFGYYCELNDTDKNDYYIYGLLIQKPRFNYKNFKQVGAFPISISKIDFNGENILGVSDIYTLTKMEVQEGMVGLNSNKDTHKTLFKDIVKIIDARKEHINVINALK